MRWPSNKEVDKSGNIGHGEGGWE